ncbi:MAG TPA: ClC family H(+)/Cl(-) exchange transporter [Silvibacterium sp.]|nr:ClC family H(+)/Cl(-) exchange transporter [Silvibacterium sp.]
MTLLKSRVIRISTASLLAGIFIGLVGGAFRYLLIAADNRRDALIAWAHAWPYIGWLAPVALGLTGAAMARIMVVRFAPAAEGSGIQRVEAVFTGEVKPAPHSVVPVKFFGGLLSMGSGLALGREGPTVQMGSTLGLLISRFLTRDDQDTRIIGAAGAGAGLAVAFNAPIGGSIFVFEELTSSFTPWLMVATLAAALVAVWIMRLMLGNTLDFTVRLVSLTQVWRTGPFLALGALLGAVGALYNAATVGLLRFGDRLRKLSSINRAAMIGATVGLVAWFAPATVGGGEALTQAILADRYAVGGLLTLFLARFLLGPWSYAAGAPGGLFAPLLVLGASSGALFAGVLNHFLPLLSLSPVACAVVGMAALFSASVRAPLTGIVLTVELTGRGDLTLGLLGASLMAMVVAMLLRSEPIYETLKRRMLAQQPTPTKIEQPAPSAL